MGVSICLSGCDGSGKTTLARYLAAYLIRYGTTKIYWIRGSHLLSSFILRILRHFDIFYGTCNPYYNICIPEKLRHVWTYIEFLSIIPYIILRFLLRKFYNFLIFDRGIIDFVVWIITTLSYPRFLINLHGKFLLKLAMKENIIYLYADKDDLIKRADVPKIFVYKEFIVYTVLMKFIAKCLIDTSRYKPKEAMVRVLKCLETV